MFQVEWHAAALAELATMWMQADSPLRQAITSGSQTLDERLRQNPAMEGESRSQGFRITFVPPLAVDFFVDYAHRIVTIAHVRLMRLAR